MHPPDPDPAVAASIAELPLLISGMDCAACAGPIADALQAVPGVLTAEVSGSTSRATVRYDARRVIPSQLFDAVQAAGYGACADTLAQAKVQRRDESRKAMWRLFVASFCAMQVMMLATPAYVAPAGDLTPEFKRLLDMASALLTLPVLVFGALPWFAAATRALRRGRVVMELPVSLGIVVAFVASCVAAFEPDSWAGSDVYFDSLCMFIGVLLAARWWEMRARHRASEALEATLSATPDTAERERSDGGVETVALAQLRPGDVVRVPLGQAFPADGALLGTPTQADEALLTGESTPVPKAAGDAVIAGSVNLGVPARVRVHRVGADTRLAALQALVRGAMSQRPAAAALADAWAAPFLVAVLTLAVLGAWAWSFIDPSRAVWVAVAVLIVTCPCALSLAVPATLLAATRGLARQGVLVRRLEALAILARVDQVVFDKTGTLSRDALGLAGVRPSAAAAELGLADPHEALAAAAALAVWSGHPRSRILVDAARSDAQPRSGAQSLAAPLEWQGIEEVIGRGVQAHDAHGRRWRLGAHAWALDDAATGAGAPEVQPANQLVMSCNGRVVVQFEIEETPRRDAVAGVAALHDLGLATMLLSGDQPAATHALAQRVGIRHWQAGASAQDKLDAVAALQAQGRRVAMVGDGFNDAPVLARADVSIAMGQAALAAREQADLVLLSDRPADAALAVATARRTLGLVRQNMLWAATYNAACIPLALVGWLPPWAAGIGMALSSVLVVANAQRAASLPRRAGILPLNGALEWKASTC